MLRRDVHAHRTITPRAYSAGSSSTVKHDGCTNTPDASTNRACVAFPHRGHGGPARIRSRRNADVSDFRIRSTRCASTSRVVGTPVTCP